MKKWILIGIMILAVSAIAASRIRNNGITLDDYFNLNSTEMNYSGEVSYFNMIKLPSQSLEGGFDTINETFISISAGTNDGGSSGLFLQNDTASLTQDNYITGTSSVISITPDEIFIANQKDGYIAFDIYPDRIDISGPINSVDNSGSGNAYACFNATGNLFRSATPCVS